MQEAAMLEGILTSSNKSGIGEGLGVRGRPPASIGNINYPGAGGMPSNADLQRMIKQRSSDDGGSLNQSALQHHKQMTESDFRATAGEVDLNDRLIDSPKQRKYVPLLSKKLSKNAHGSSENVILTDTNSQNSAARAAAGHYELRQAST